MSPVFLRLQATLFMRADARKRQVKIFAALLAILLKRNPLQSGKTCDIVKTAK